MAVVPLLNPGQARPAAPYRYSRGHCPWNRPAVNSPRAPISQISSVTFRETSRSGQGRLLKPKTRAVLMNSLLGWLRGAGKASLRFSRRPTRIRRAVPRLEALEDRLTPAAISWTGLGDGINWMDR